jgi:hypothetical protein
MKLLRALGYFWYDFIVGDDWKIAAYVILALAVSAAAADSGAADAVIGVCGTALLLAFFILGVSYDARKQSK